MAEAMESPSANPLSSDSELFQMYLDALDTVLGTPDVRRSFDEFGLSAGIVRIRMLRDAHQVLKAAPREFAAYQNAVSHELSALAVDPTVTRQRSIRNLVPRLGALVERLIVPKRPVSFYSSAMTLEFGHDVVAAKLQDTLYDIAVHLAADHPIINVVDIIAGQSRSEPPEVARVRLDLAAYAYYCATLQEVFTGDLDDARMIKATGTPSEPGSFDALARARNAFTTDTLLAWNLITQCRIAWSLEPREPTGKSAHNRGSSRPDARPDPAAATMSPGKSLRTAAGRAASGGS